MFLGCFGKNACSFSFSNVLSSQMHSYVSASIVMRRNTSFHSGPFANEVMSACALRSNLIHARTWSSSKSNVDDVAGMTSLDGDEAVRDRNHDKTTKCLMTVRLLSMISQQ